MVQQSTPKTPKATKKAVSPKPKETKQNPRETPAFNLSVPAGTEKEVTKTVQGKEFTFTIKSN